MTMHRWWQTPFMMASLAAHLFAALLVLVRADLWPWALGAVLLDHLAMCVGGLWPRSTLLGPNLVRLPEDAALRREVAITIDDGPDPDVTPQVLAILSSRGAHATFFCIGERAAAHPDLCRAIVAAGHAVENHGQRHRHHSAFFGPRAWLREVAAAQATLEAITDRRPAYFRAVAGLRNPFLEPVLSSLGLRLATWTRRGYDTRTRDPERVLHRLTRCLLPGDILLLHDGHCSRTSAGRPVILEVLPRLLDEIAARKLTPVTLGSVCKPT